MINVINPGWMDLLEAQSIAKDVYELLAPHCDMIHVAGSIRRQESKIGDIEIVCLSKTQFIKSGKLVTTSPKPLTLFEPEECRTDHVEVTEEDVSGKYIPIDPFIYLVNSWEKIKGEPTGRYTQRKLPNKVKLDLFMPTRSDYYRQLAIRTGDVNYARYVIARSWKRKGWCGTENGLRLIEQCEEKNNTWKCIVDNPTLPPEWKSEKEFFEFIGVSLMTPQYRIVTQHEINTIHKKKF
jgi:hypothetical protein